MVQQTVGSPQRIFALLVGVVFTVLGVVGLLLTRTMQVGEVFGVFDVDLFHNILLLGTALMAYIAVLSPRPRTFNIVFGIFYLVLGLAGLLPALYFPTSAYGTDNGLFLGLMHNNFGDHILHIAAGVLALLVSLIRDPRPRMTAETVLVQPERVAEPDRIVPERRADPERDLR